MPILDHMHLIFFQLFICKTPRYFFFVVVSFVCSSKSNINNNNYNHGCEIGESLIETKNQLHNIIVLELGE